MYRHCCKRVHVGIITIVPTFPPQVFSPGYSDILIGTLIPLRPKSIQLLRRDVNPVWWAWRQHSLSYLSVFYLAEYYHFPKCLRKRGATFSIEFLRSSRKSVRGHGLETFQPDSPVSRVHSMMTRSIPLFDVGGSPSYSDTFYLTPNPNLYPWV